MFLIAILVLTTTTYFYIYQSLTVSLKFYMSANTGRMFLLIQDLLHFSLLCLLIVTIFIEYFFLILSCTNDVKLLP